MSFSVAQSSLFGAGSHAIEVIFLGHFLDRLKVEREIYPYISSNVQAYKNIIQQSGYKGFYRGFKANVALSSIKGGTGWPINHLCDRIGQQCFSENTKKKHPLVFTSAIGIVTGSLEAGLFVCPLNRIKTLQMASKGSLSKSVKITRDKGVHYLYVGLRTSMLRQSVTWVSYLCSYEKIKSHIIKDNDLNPITKRVALGVFTGFFSSVFISPFDFVLTQVQKIEDPIDFKVRSLFKYGFQSFYNNFTLRVVRTSWSCTIVICILDHFKALPPNMALPSKK